jgi:predicted transcriptional regulator
MAEHEISAKLKQFIFEYVDSVELIEVLLLMRNNFEKWFSATQISTELRSNPTSISKRLMRLVNIGLLEQNNDKDQFRYKPASLELKEIVSELSNEYLLRRHSIFELIFSSSKNARQFANAFIVNKANKPDGES